MPDTPPDIGSFVALGDSFSEGVGDPYPDGTGYGGPGYRGWADRFAERLAADRPDLRYANLAVRGRLVGQVVAEQVPRADPDALAQTFDAAIAQLQAASRDADQVGRHGHGAGHLLGDDLLQ